MPARSCGPQATVPVFKSLLNEPHGSIGIALRHPSHLVILHQKMQLEALGASLWLYLCTTLCMLQLCTMQGRL